MDGSLSPGLVTDLQVGESLVIAPDDPQRRVVVTIEAKSGQRVRVRLQSPDRVVVRREKSS